MCVAELPRSDAQATQYVRTPEFRTLETASRGLIYDHRPASVLAERLATTLKPVLAEAGQGAGSSFERDAAVVLRRLEEAVRASALSIRRTVRRSWIF